MNYKIKLIFPFLFLLASAPCIFAQVDVADFKEVFRVENNKSDHPIKVDGILDEDIWKSQNLATDFWQKIPYFDEGADPRTEVRFTYDDNYLYMGALCIQEVPIVIQSLKRDEFWDNDGIAMTLDPLNTRTNAFLFGVTAAGAQWDAQYAANSGINSNWSNKWKAEVKIYDGYWTAEIAIPFKILRYDPTKTEWGVNIVRGIQAINEFHNWTAVPESFWPPNPAFAGAMVWDQAPKATSGNYNLIPYVTASVNSEPNSNPSCKANAGLDARIALSSTINADLTLNPDFSQIEVDEQVTNLTRFSIFLPEKRTFFLENSDVFGNFGVGSVRPFFSRRIGIDENGNAIPLIYGLRATGNLTETLRAGVMNTHTASNDENTGLNQSAISVQKRYGLSYIQGLFTNQHGFDGINAIDGSASRNLSLEGNYTTNDGQKSIWGGLHRSFKSGYTDKAGFYTAGARFQNANWELSADFMSVQENYATDMGYNIRIENYDALRDTSIRVGFNQTYSYADYVIRPAEGKIIRHRFGVENLLVFNPDWSFNERFNRLRYFLTFRNTSELNIRFDNNELELLFPFSFVSNGDPLPAARYNYSSINLEFGSDERKLFQYDLSTKIGQFYNGTLNQFTVGLNYRVQPWGNFGIEYEFNQLNFPESYGNGLITALRSKVEIGFSRNLLWTNLFQFVDQRDFMGINSRLQWRFAPMSDLFLVYIDNYDVLGPVINTRNRAVALKLNYWY